MEASTKLHLRQEDTLDRLFQYTEFLSCPRKSNTDSTCAGLYVRLYGRQYGWLTLPNADAESSSLINDNPRRLSSKTAGIVHLGAASGENDYCVSTHGYGLALIAQDGSQKVIRAFRGQELVATIEPRASNAVKLHQLVELFEEDPDEPVVDLILIYSINNSVYRTVCGVTNMTETLPVFVPDIKSVAIALDEDIIWVVGNGVLQAPQEKKASLTQSSRVIVPTLYCISNAGVVLHQKALTITTAGLHSLRLFPYQDGSVFLVALNDVPRRATSATTAPMRTYKLSFGFFFNKGAKSWSTEWSEQHCMHTIQPRIFLGSKGLVAATRVMDGAVRSFINCYFTVFPVDTNPVDTATHLYTDVRASWIVPSLVNGHGPVFLTFKEYWKQWEIEPVKLKGKIQATVARTSPPEPPSSSAAKAAVSAGQEVKSHSSTGLKNSVREKARRMLSSQKKVVVDQPIKSLARAEHQPSSKPDGSAAPPTPHVDWSAIQAKESSDTMSGSNSNSTDELLTAIRSVTESTETETTTETNT